jgi:hypothetical protein
MADVSLWIAAKPAMHLLLMELMSLPLLPVRVTPTPTNQNTAGAAKAIRRMQALPRTIYIVFCMITKQALITG